ncbi:MAG: DUF3769 domain-containing protein [Cyanobacteria bacterium]|nr:DUF3769 domain-containing protein [Cyanobacteriota bacterium]
MLPPARTVRRTTTVAGLGLAGALLLAAQPAPAQDLIERPQPSAAYPVAPPPPLDGSRPLAQAPAGAGQNSPPPAATTTTRLPADLNPFAAAPSPGEPGGSPTKPVPAPLAGAPAATLSGGGTASTKPPATPPSPLLPAAVPLELELQADRQGYDAQMRRFVSSGHVSARLAGARLLADRIEIDTESRTLYAYGSVRLQRGMQYMQASRLRYSLLEGMGELEDVYGVLDLDGSQTDFDLAAMPSVPLVPAEPLACPPTIPAPPQWHPYPWAVTAWAGQMFAANFGDTFIFKGRLRPEYLTGLGLQRRLIDAGPLALELDTTLLGHRAAQQPGGPYNQAVPYADTPAQTFAEATVGLGARLWLQPWLNLYFVEGVSLLSQPSNYEKTFRQNYSTFLNYLAFEVEALVTPQLSAVGRIHHRSGAYGVYSGVSEGSNAYLLGLRYRWGQAKPLVPPLELPPAQGCPGAPEPGQEKPESLAEQLQVVTMGPRRLAQSTPPAPTAAAPVSSAGTTASAPQAASQPPTTRQGVWAAARQQERQRQAAIATLDQRVTDVQFQQSLVAERRRGFPNYSLSTDTANNYGGIRPSQLSSLSTASNKQLVRGTISRWRFQARRLRITPTTLSGDRVGFSNDPFTPAQSWLDSENVVATLQANGDTVIKASRNRLRLEDRLPISVTRSTTIQKQEEVDNRLVFSYDQEDRDGYYLGYKIPIAFGAKGTTTLTLEPQFLAQRAINGSTEVYPLPGQPVQSAGVYQPATSSDLFGLDAKLSGQLLGFNSSARVELSTFNPENIPDGTRSWAEMARNISVPLLGDATARLFGAYRFRTWNGTLGEQDVYTAYGLSFDDTSTLPTWGRLSSNYYWRAGIGNYQSNPYQSTNLSDLWRANAIGSLNLSYNIWTGKPAAPTIDKAFLNTAQPVVPGLSLNANVLGTLAYYGDGTNQNTIGISGGPTLTLGHFVRPFLDFTQLTITGGGTLKQGISPLSFDRAVDLNTLGIGLTQQLVGPLVFSGGIGLNVDPNSTNYGDVTGSYIELRWQRRAYEIGLFYSPYDGLGGLRIKLNDFNFKGTGRPFVPYTYNPSQTILNRPF